MTRETIAGRYDVVRAVGHGGMGTVWLCRDILLGRDVALKQVGVLPGESVPDVARALREARSSAALNHRHVVSVFDAVEADDHIWLVMEYVPGETLSQLIAREGRLDPERVAAIGAQVADGLAAAHARGTVHRDVKPGNVLVSGDVAKVSDFGIARTEGDDQLTRSGIVMGTPLYFSPELARGEDPSPAADVWALGATLYTAVEGVPPVADRGNPLATLAAIARARPPRPEHAGFLTDAIGRMLDPDPVSRWTMVDAAHALRRLHEKHRPPGTLATPRVDEAAPARGPAPGAAVVQTPAVDHGTGTAEVRAPASSDRRFRWPLLAGSLVLLILAGIGVALLMDGDPGPSAGNGTNAGERSGSPSVQRSTDEPTSPSPATPSATAATTPSGTGSRSTTSGTGSGSTPSSGSTSPRTSAAGRARTVADYYSLLPGDTRSAWGMLSPDVQAKIGGYDTYAAFWRTVEDVSVDAVSATDDVVTAHLTYTTDRGREGETRQLQVERAGGDWLITEDLGPVAP